MKPDIEIAIRTIMQDFNAQKFDKPEAIKRFRMAMGAGKMGTALPSDEDIFTSAEELINGWDENTTLRVEE